jgi:hypothetical protein
MKLSRAKEIQSLDLWKFLYTAVHDDNGDINHHHSNLTHYFTLQLFSSTHLAHLHPNATMKFAAVLAFTAGIYRVSATVSTPAPSPSPTKHQTNTPQAGIGAVSPLLPSPSPH